MRSGFFIVYLTWSQTDFRTIWQKPKNWPFGGKLGHKNGEISNKVNELKGLDNTDSDDDKDANV